MAADSDGVTPASAALLGSLRCQADGADSRLRCGVR